MNKNQLEALSHYLNGQANLPVAIQEIAELLKTPAPTLVEKVKSFINKE